MQPSSQDLHPKSGARFVFERLELEPPRYAVAIYLAGGQSWRGELRWHDGRAELEAAEPEPKPAAAAEVEQLDWAREQALKLARVLHRDPKAKLVRWRGQS